MNFIEIINTIDFPTGKFGNQYDKIVADRLDVSIDYAHKLRMVHNVCYYLGIEPSAVTKYSPDDIDIAIERMRYFIGERDELG